MAAFPRSFTRPLVVGILAAAVAALAAACGQSPSGGNPAASSGTGSSVASRAVAYASCMRAHGLPKFPDPTPGGHGQGPVLGFSINGQSESFNLAGTGIDPISSQFAAAQKACIGKMGMPGGGPGNAGPTSPQMKQAGLAFAACMRSHGFPTFPDPTFGAAPSPPKSPGGGGGFGFAIASNGGGSMFFRVKGIDPKSAQYQSAFNACQPKLQLGQGGKAGQ